MWNWCITHSRCSTKQIHWQSDAFRHPLKQRRWLGLQMLEGDIYSRAYAGEASQHLDAALARLRNEMDDPALHIADARYQCIAAICDVVSNTDGRTQPFHHCGR